MEKIEGERLAKKIHRAQKVTEGEIDQGENEG